MGSSTKIFASLFLFCFIFVNAILLQAGFEDATDKKLKILKLGCHGRKITLLQYLPGYGYGCKLGFKELKKFEKPKPKPDPSISEVNEKDLINEE